MICSDNRETRRLLRDYCWRVSTCGYGKTTIGNTTKFYHQLYLNYAEELVADHINHKRFDNRFENLRVVSHQQNMRNKITQSNNTSGKPGVQLRMKTDVPYWAAIITDNDGKRIERAFNIDKLGNDEAYARAVQSRRDMEALYDYRGE